MCVRLEMIHGRRRQSSLFLFPTLPRIVVRHQRLPVLDARKSFSIPIQKQNQWPCSRILKKSRSCFYLTSPETLGTSSRYRPEKSILSEADTFARTRIAPTP